MKSNWLEYALLTGFAIFIMMLILTILPGLLEVFIGWDVIFVKLRNVILEIF